MSKNVNKKHNFKHLEKVYKTAKQETSDSGTTAVASNKYIDSIPMGRLIVGDLKRSTVLIISIVLLVIILGIVIFRTDLLSSVLEKFSLSY